MVSRHAIEWDTLQVGEWLMTRPITRVGCKTKSVLFFSKAVIDIGHYYYLQKAIVSNGDRQRVINKSREPETETICVCPLAHFIVTGSADSCKREREHE